MLAGAAFVDSVPHLAAGMSDARALQARVAAGDKQALRDAARQFESLMVTQMLKTMRETRFSDEDDPLSGGDGAKLYRDLLDQQWASSITRGRGIGFADMMIKALERQADDMAGASPDKASAAPVAAAAPHATPIRVPDGALAATPLAATAPAVAAPPAGTAQDRKSRFLDTMRAHAEVAASATGVPARFILAQAALESGWGEREIRAADGRNSHNLFGIKATPAWRGGSMETVTTEYREGLPMQLTQRFRAYADYAEGFADYAQLLRRRYGEALAGGDDAAGFARGLAANGYATDPRYAEKLLAVIASVARAGV